MRREIFKLHQMAESSFYNNELILFTLIPLFISIHANEFENLFREPDNFRYFLDKYQFHIGPIAETYAWCLMPNHFHFVLRIKEQKAIIRLNSFSKVPNFGKALAPTDQPTNSEIEKFLSKQFANLFSSYTQAFNKLHNRSGSLFIKNFKRKTLITNQELIDAIIYTHRNPIHHGFRKAFQDWEYSSYHSILSNESGIVEYNDLLKITGGKKGFIELHQKNLDYYNQSKST